MTNPKRTIDEGRPLDGGVRRLSADAARLLEELVQGDPLLRKAWEARCNPKTECRRGPFGCDCERNLK